MNRIDPKTARPNRPIRIGICLSGLVQDVGFRPHVHRLAKELHLQGWILNNSRGVRVTIELEGSPEAGIVWQKCTTLRIAVMASREGLEFETTLVSDYGPLSPMVENLLAENVEIHCMRDLTRGGLATALLEICSQAQVEVVLDGTVIPIEGAVKGACEILGLDPLYVANEGCFAAFLPV